jgi:enoyl-CoA hydratase/carnithine racemase
LKTVSLQEFLPTPTFDEYREQFKDFFILDRRDDGVLLAQAHTRGDSIKLSVQNHRALGQFLKTVGADPKNEVLILTGSGRDWMMGSDPQDSKSRKTILNTGHTNTPIRTAAPT